MENYLIDLIKGMIASSPAIGIIGVLAFLYLRKIYAEITEKIKSLEINHSDCREHNFDMHDEDKRELSRLDREILKGINEIKVIIARTEGRNSLAEDIAKILKAGINK